MPAAAGTAAGTAASAAAATAHGAVGGGTAHGGAGGCGDSAGGHSSELIYGEMLRRVREEQEQLGQLINHPF